MPGPLKRVGEGRRRRFAALLVVSIAGFAIAALVGVALGKSITLGVAKNIKVGTKKESIVTNHKGVTVYVLTPETTHHLLCTSSLCLSFWFPLKVPSAKTKLSAPGIKGKLGTTHRKGFFQVTLSGHPLYMFKLDNGKKSVANGDKIMSFGGTWHVITVKTKRATNSPTPTTGTTTTPMTPYTY